MSEDVRPAPRRIGDGKPRTVREATPPCLKPGYDWAAHQRHYERWAAQWRAALGIAPLDTKDGDAA